MDKCKCCTPYQSHFDKSHIPEIKPHTESLMDFGLSIDGCILVANYDSYSVDSSFYEGLKINYCPMCGIKL